MEHPALRELIQAGESIGIQFRDDSAYVPCRRCKRTRRFAPEKLATLRFIGIVFCLDCIRGLQLATTQQDQIIV